MKRSKKLSENKTVKEDMQKVKHDLYGNGTPGLFQEVRDMRKLVNEITKLGVYVKVSVFILMILSFDDLGSLAKFLFKLIK